MKLSILRSVSRLISNYTGPDESDLIQRYGEEEAQKLWTFAFSLDGLFKHSEECVGLDTGQYFEKKMAQEPDRGHDSPG